jgi:hypothetical protein
MTAGLAGGRRITMYLMGITLTNMGISHSLMGITVELRRIGAQLMGISIDVT